MITGRVIVAIGDPNGIGPEVAVKAAAHLWEHDKLRPILVGDISAVRPHADELGIPLVTSRTAWHEPGRKIDVCPIKAIPDDNLSPGTVSAAAGAATITYVETALSLVKAGVGRCIVGCPHSETAVNASGRTFSGYPGLLADLLGTGPDSVFLMLVGGGLRIIHVTLHEAIGSALARLSPSLIVKATLAGAAGLNGLGIARPRIGLFGINPHAGENGLFGREDQEIVTPAVDLLKRQGIDVEGPVGADVMLTREGYDAFVAMYHDQGHIPVKLIAGRTASALAIGGGVLFSSVGHGAAFDIAGKGIADPEATLRTIKLLGGKE